MRSEPVEVATDDHEAMVDRVASVDVAKASGTVCTRVPHDSIRDRRVTKVWEVAATTNAIMGLTDELVGQGIQRVVVESTSDYWRPFVYLLQVQGLTTWLVNARDVKQVPGRPKTDKLDAVWLAKLNERGMLRPSFIPPADIRQLRHYTRLRVQLTEERSRHKQRVEKLLEDALIKVSTVATDIFGVSGRAMIEALIAGERDPQVLASLAKGRMRSKRAALVEALSGRFDDHHAELIKMVLDHIDALTAQIAKLTERIDELLAQIPAAQAPPPNVDSSSGRHDDNAPLNAVARLDEIPGIGIQAARGCRRGPAPAAVRSPWRRGRRRRRTPVAAIHRPHLCRPGPLHLRRGGPSAGHRTCAGCQPRRDRVDRAVHRGHAMAGPGQASDRGGDRLGVAGRRRDGDAAVCLAVGLHLRRSGRLRSPRVGLARYRRRVGDRRVRAEGRA